MTINHFNSFQEHLNSYKSDLLKEFLKLTFSDKALLTKFLTLPASCNHHHAEYGGLLRHSLEVAEIIGNQSFPKPHQRELAMVAGFLHDLGKTETIQSVGQLSSLGMQVDHAYLNFQVCAHSLRWLDKEWKEAANYIRHAWSCGSFNAKYGYAPNSSMALMVKHADQQSVHLDLEQKAFENKRHVKGIHFYQQQRFHRVGRRPVRF